MSITIYEPAPVPASEARRERAVEASGALAAADDPVLTDLARQARAALGTAMAAVVILYRDWQYLIASAGVPGGVYSRATSFCGHVLATGDGFLCVPDATRDERFAGNPNVVEAGGVRFYAGAALTGGSGDVLGALCVWHPVPLPAPAAPLRERLRVLAETAVRHLEMRGVAPPAVTPAETMRISA